MPFVYMRFIKGDVKRFNTCLNEVKKLGYPDVPTYLNFNGIEKRWCEQLPDDEAERIEKARLLRISLKQNT